MRITRVFEVAGPFAATAMVLCFACVGGGGPLPTQESGNLGDRGEDPSGSGDRENPNRPSEDEAPAGTTTPANPGSGPSQGLPDSGIDNKTCTPGAFTFCRCSDGASGTAKCQENGVTRDECVCSSPAPPDAG